MQRLLQALEFSYPDGYLFLDRGGAICQRLRQRFPQLVAKAVDRLQIDMHQPDKGLELYFGVRTAFIQQTSHEGEDFGTVAADFVRILAEVLELSSLESFRYQQIVGRACASMDAATALMRPFMVKEAQERLGQLASETEWRAVQAEYRRNNLLFQDRIAVVELIPREATSSSPVPHITVQFDIKGVAPVEFSALDIRTLVRNLGREHLEVVLAKIAPHLAVS